MTAEARRSARGVEAVADEDDDAALGRVGRFGGERADGGVCRVEDGCAAIRERRDAEGGARGAEVACEGERPLGLLAELHDGDA